MHTMSETPLGWGNHHLTYKLLRFVTFSSYRTLWNENQCPVSSLEHITLAIQHDSNSSGCTIKFQNQRIYMDWTKQRQPGRRNVTNLKSITPTKRTVTYFYLEDEKRRCLNSPFMLLQSWNIRSLVLRSSYTSLR
jgi:hypothetical protein